MKRRVVFVYRGGRGDLAAAAARGAAPDEFLYGLPEFEKAGWETSVVEARPGFVWFKPFLAPFERLFTRLFGLGFPLTYALNGLRTLRSADVVVGTTDGCALPVMFLKKLGLLRGKVFVISQGLYRIADNLKNQPGGKARLRVLRGLFAEAERVVVFGEGDAAAYGTRFGGGWPPASVCHFGIDADFWTPAPRESCLDVLSVGSDALRDYPTLLRAVGGNRCRIVTRLSLKGEAIPPETEVSGDATWEELRELYRSAKVVVIPVKNQPRDSGHSATLQAMACGRAVILSDTKGLWDRAGLRHGENIWLVPPENPGALADAISLLLADSALRARIESSARAYVLSGHTSADFGRGLLRIAGVN